MGTHTNTSSTYEKDHDIFQRVAPLVSAWGTAVEEGKDSTSQLDALRNLYIEEPESLKLTLELAENFQKAFISNNINKDNVSKTSPSHPIQRLARISKLKTIVGIV